MTDTVPASPHSFVVQKQTSDPTQPPLEVYHLSHDLRGPLNSILGFAELLLEEVEGPLNEIQQADIGAIYQSAQNLLHLINTIVDLSKLEANRLSFDFKAVDLSVLIEAALIDLAPFKPEPIELLNNLRPTLPSLWADQSRVEQIVKDLLRSAFKLTKKGPINLTAQSQDQQITLRVEIGQATLPQTEVAGLFELKVKVDPTGRSSLGRGGLELPLVRYLVEKQQGRIWAEGHSNGDLIIHVTLPVAP